MITIKEDRSVFIPQGEELLGYAFDHGAMTRQFLIKEHLPEGSVFRIDVEGDTDVIIPEVTPLPDGRTVLTWQITSAVTQNAGVVTVQLRAFDTGGTLIWHSAPIDFRCERSLYTVHDASDEPIITEFEQLEQRVELVAEHCEDCADEAAETLRELEEEVGDVSDTIRALGAHLLDKDNPHEVTAEDVSAYTAEETDTLLGGKVNANGGTANDLNVTGTLYVVDNETETAIEIDAEDKTISGVHGIAFDPDASGTISGLRSVGLQRSDAASAGYVDDAVDEKLDKDGGTMTGELKVSVTSGGDTQTATLGGNALSFNSPGHIYNLTATPVIDEAASRRYVDGVTSDGCSGKDLTAVFAEEISASPYSGNAWAWIKARIQSGNFDGIRVKDFIPFVIGSKTYHAEVAGINTYKGFGDTETRNHIDFISRELYETSHSFNPVAFNNGTKFGSNTATEYPWLASDLYLWLNSLSGTVASAAAAGGGSGTAVDYTSDGLYYRLPSALKAVISEKRMYLEKRYNASSLLTASSGGGWANAGKLWLPAEYEVFGLSVLGTALGSTAMHTVQYPIFSSVESRAKRNIGATTRRPWMMMTAGSNQNICCIQQTVIGGLVGATTALTMPICFRIEADAPLTAMGAPASEEDGE